MTTREAADILAEVTRWRDRLQEAQRRGRRLLPIEIDGLDRILRDVELLVMVIDAQAQRLRQHERVM